MLRKKFFNSGGLLSGTTGLFTINAGSTANLYQFATATVTTTTLNANSGRGAGTSVMAIIANGNATRKYNYSSNTNVAGTTIPLGGSVLRSQAFGNNTTGIFVQGSSVNTAKYTYAGDGCVASTILTRSSVGGYGCGNLAVALYALGGISSSDETNVTNTYTYAGDVVAVGTNMLGLVNNGGAAGTAAFGIFTMSTDGGSSLLASKYTYASTTMASATNFNSAKFRSGAAGNDALGVFTNGTATSVRNWAADTSALGTVLSVNNESGCATSNGTTGVNM